MRSAFTMLEVLIVTAMTVLLIAVGVPVFTSLQTFAATESVASPLLGDLRLAQLRTMTGAGVHGAYLASDRYTLYVGATYATRDATRDRVMSLDSGVMMAFRGFTGGSGPLDVRFAAVTGAPSDTGTITVTHTSGRTQFLAIRPSGLIEETRSGTVTLTADADATLSESAPAANFGVAANLEVYPWEPLNTRRSVLRFPLAAIPRGATITSARLTIQATQTYGATRTVALHRILRPWDERAVSWQGTGAASWTAAGGDFAVQASETAQLTWTGTLPAATLSVTDDVQQMVSGAVANDGWLLKDSTEDSSQRYWFFSSRDGGTAPQLVVTYAF